MSCAANPNKPKQANPETAAAAAAKKLKEEQDRIRRLLITLGDVNQKVIGQIRGLAGALEDDVDMHGELMSDTLLDCAKSLPLKTCIYAAFTRRMMDKHPAWVKEVIPRAQDELRSAIRTGQMTTALLLLHFFASLGNCGVLGLSQVMGLLREVLALSSNLRPAKGGDLGVFLALSTLPFFSAASYAKIAEEVDALIAGAGGYLRSRDARWAPLLRFLKAEDISDRLEGSVAALQSLKAASWTAQSVLHVPGFDSKLEADPEGPQLAPLGITSEDVRKSKIRHQVPLMSSRFLTASAVDDGADDAMPAHDRWVLEGYMISVLEMFGRDVDECAKQILKIPILHPQFEAIAVETVFSQMLRLPSPPLLPLFYSRLLQAMSEKQTSTKVLVEKAIAALITRIPDFDEECLEVFAETFALHLMHNGYRSEWDLFTGENAAVQTQRFVRRALDRLQRLSFHQNLLHRLPEAVHVYVPPEPLPATGLPVQASPEFKRMLGLVKLRDPSEKHVVDFCRLLQHQDLRDAEAAEGAEGGIENGNVKRLQEGIDDGAPAKKQRVDDKDGEASRETPEGPEDGLVSVKEEAPAPQDKEMCEGTTLDVKQEQDAKEEKPVKVPKEWLEGSKEAEAKEEDHRPEQAWSLEAVTELFVTAMMQVGSKTPTHMSKVLDGYQQILAKLKPADDEDAHRFLKDVVRCIFQFWRHSSQRLEITIDGLLQRGVITARAVVEHALADRGPQGCDSMAVWNMINTMASKSLELSQSVRVELAIAKKLGKTEALESCRRQLDTAIQGTAELFTLVFTGLVRNYQDFEDGDPLLRHVMLQRILTMGRKYNAFIKPLIDAAESRIPGVAHNPDVAAVFQSLSTL